jgi:hypothetical protein
MTQHTEEFIQECITVTADGSLVSVDEAEGLYLHWRSLRTASADTTDITDSADGLDGAASDDDGPLLRALRGHGVERVDHDGVEYLEGLVLTGPVVADFFLSCDFAGAWGRPDAWELALIRDLASAS